MGLFNFWKKDKIDESIKAFHNKGAESNLTDKQLIARSGEGIEEIIHVPYGSTQYGAFNNFYNRYIHQAIENSIHRIKEYRKIAETPEIADVIEDAIIESTLINDSSGCIFTLGMDEKIKSNDNITNNINDEFYNLFINRLDINNEIWDIFKTYLIDGKVFYERVIDVNNTKNGIIGIKKLPTETMNRVYDPMSGRTLYFYQNLGKNAGTTINKSREELEKDPNVIVFNKEQIGYIDYGMYGINRNDIFGYLEKARIPYNQLKLLETSVVIYRIVRAPERYVFVIDVGNMPADKARKYVEKVKGEMTRRQSYDTQTGQLVGQAEVLSMNDNFFIPTSPEGRGSRIETVGGQGTAGFTELDDIYYFANKLYRALKYPLSRIENKQEKRSGDILFGGQSVSEISRDEIKWAKFLERQQNKFVDEFRNLFLLHLGFKGIKKQYDLTKESIFFEMAPPSHYKEQMEQRFLETKVNNYQSLANNEEFSKSWLMERYLDMTEEEIEENWKGFKKDKELNDKYKPNSEEDRYR